MKRPEFTQEQEYWICYMIGDWYLSWKDRIVNYDDKTNSLGRAKEELKYILCQDEDEFIVRGCKL